MIIKILSNLKKYNMIYLLIMLAFAPSKVFSGLFIPGSGGNVLGRGGVFVAKADDLSCLWYNPAGLSKIEGFTIELNLFQDFLTESFEREEEYSILQAIETGTDTDFGYDYFDKSSSEIQIYPLPNISMSYNIPSIDLTVAFSPFFAPNIADVFRYFPDKKGGRYVTLNQDISLYFPQIAVGWEPLDWLRIGGSFEVGFATGFMELIVNAAFPPQTPSSKTELLTDPRYRMYDSEGNLSYTEEQLISYKQDRERYRADVIVQAHADDIKLFCWGAVGIMITPVPELEIGVSYRPGVEFTMYASLSSPSLENETEFFDPDIGYNTHSPLHEDAVYGLFLNRNGEPIPIITGFEGADKDDAIGLILKLPPILRVGVRYIIEGYGDIEVDFTWEGNGLMGPNEFVSNFTLEVNPELAEIAESVNLPFTNIPVDNVTLNETIKDNWYVGIGTDWNVIEDKLTLRAGLFYETGMQEEEEITSLYDVWHIGATVGVSYHIYEWLVVDFSYGIMAFPDVTVANTTLSSMNIPTQLIIDKIEGQLNDPTDPDYIDPSDNALREQKQQELDFYYDELLNHVQDGLYERFDHLIALGITFLFDL